MDILFCVEQMQQPRQQQELMMLQHRVHYHYRVAQHFLQQLQIQGATSYDDNIVTDGNTYYYALIPFNWDGTNSETYNYKTDSYNSNS
jgi:hypothetical protein